MKTTNMFELFAGAVENAQDNNIKLTATYFTDYAENYLEEPIFLSVSGGERLAEMAVLAAQGTNDYYNLIEKPLSEMKFNN